jgi:hypothetical protein
VKNNTRTPLGFPRWGKYVRLIGIRVCRSPRWRYWMTNPGCTTEAGNNHQRMYVRNIVSRHGFIMWRASADEVEALEIWTVKRCRKPTTSEPSDVRLSCNESPCWLKFKGDDRKLVWDQRMTRRPVTKMVEPRLVPVTSCLIAYVEGHAV